MSAPELREAADLMRERAEAATPGPWRVGDFDDVDPLIFNPVVVGRRGEGVWIAECGPEGENGNEDAAHVASWHPAVAAAVAAWLDSEADRLADLTHATPNVVVSDGVLHEWGFGHALDVARAYLGGAA